MDIGGIDYIIYCYLITIILFIIIFPLIQLFTNDEIVIIKRFILLSRILLTINLIVLDVPFLIMSLVRGEKIEWISFFYFYKYIKFLIYITKIWLGSIIY